jgi:ribosomal protein S12 methylthiotransferase
MNRPWQAGVNDSIIERLKEALPVAVLRTTFIVGFPGETDEQFDHLLQFVQRHEFDHVGVFTFSPEEGTPAYDLPNPISPEVMEARLDALMQMQQPIALKRNRTQVGKVVDVLIEQENSATGQYIGRSARFSPDVDGLVYVRGKARLGSMIPVLIENADIYDLSGRVARAADALQRESVVVS